jgi:hypothetical protein
MIRMIWMLVLSEEEPGASIASISSVDRPPSRER